MTLAMVMGAGSSRGALQLGAIEVLYEHGIDPDFYVGSSIGAINGAFLAQAPTLENLRHLQDLYRQTDFRDVFGGAEWRVMLNMLRGEESLFESNGLEGLLRQEFEATTFEELEKPCYIVATEINSGEMRVFGDDPNEDLIESLISTSAMMPLHPPHRLNGHEYADGALKAALPLQVAVDRDATDILALNLTTQLKPSDDRNSAVDMLLHSIDLLLQSQVGLMRRHVESMDGIRLQVINLEPDQYTSFQDLDHMDELFDEGRELARAALPTIQETMSKEIIR